MSIKANATDKQFSEVKAPQLNHQRVLTQSQIYLEATHTAARKLADAARQKIQRGYSDIDSKRPRSTFGEAKAKPANS